MVAVPARRAPALAGTPPLSHLPLAWVAAGLRSSSRRHKRHVRLPVLVVHLPLVQAGFQLDAPPLLAALAAAVVWRGSSEASLLAVPVAVAALALEDKALAFRSCLASHQCGAG